MRRSVLSWSGPAALVMPRAEQTGTRRRRLRPPVHRCRTTDRGVLHDVEAGSSRGARHAGCHAVLTCRAAVGQGPCNGRMPTVPTASCRAIRPRHADRVMLDRAIPTASTGRVMPTAHADRRAMPTAPSRRRRAPAGRHRNGLDNTGLCVAQRGMRLHDKVAIVTGGGGGMGRGICACLTREGADVVVSDLDLERARETVAAAEQAGRRGLAVEGDVTSEDDCTAVVRQALDAFGQVDILVNNAGHFGHTLALPFTNLTGQDWDDNFAVNVKGPFFMCKAVAAHMMERRYGKIVNISSISAKRDPIFLPNYAAAKNAVLSLTRVVAKQLGPYNVNANAVCPGLVWTPFWERLAPMLVEQDPDRSGQDPRAVFDEVAGAAVLGRPQTPEDVGNLVAFLSSEEACNITGQAIHVDGGIAMG